MRLALARIIALSLIALIAVPLLPVGRSLAAGTLDQAQTNQSTGAANFHAGQFQGQTFTAGLTGALDQVNIGIVRFSAPGAGNFTVEIRTVDGSGLPTSTVLASGSGAMTAVPFCCTLPAALITVPLSPPASVVAGTQYAIVLTADSAFGAIAEVPGTYSLGTFVANETGTWGDLPIGDVAFQTFVTHAAVSVADAQAFERDSGVGYLVFPVTLNFAVGADVTAPYTLVNGSATGGADCAPGTDFVNTGGTVTVPAGRTVGFIAVPICGDTVVEQDKTLTVTLGAPTQAVLGTGQAIGTIRNDDSAPPTSTPTPVPTFATGPTATPAPVRVSAQRAGANRLLVTIAASGPIERVAWPEVPNVTVETADGTPITTGSLTPPQGSTTAVFYVRRLGGGAATLPLTVTGQFPTWQTFVGGGPSAW